MRLMRWSMITVLVVVAVVAMGSAIGAEERALYVAPTGNDSWKGTLDKPFATISKARDAVRAEIKRGLKMPVTVYIRGGCYELSKPLVFTPMDSGTESCPITYRAYPGEKPVISGGKKIAGPWRRIEDGVNVLSIPAVKAGDWYFRQLFRDGIRQTRARTPNKGYLVIEETDPELGKTALRYSTGDVTAWNNLTDVEFVVFHSWNESRCIVSEIDVAAQTVHFKGRVGGRGVGRGGRRNRYFIENARELLDKPGEWYLDRVAGDLYYLPPDENVTAELRAPVLTEILRLQGDRDAGNHVRYLRICGLTFCDADWTLPSEGYPSCGDVGDIVPPSAITFDGADNCVFADNTIRNVGTYAFEVTGSGNRIEDNTIHDCGSGGIISRSYQGARNIIVYNHIHDCGEVYASAVGINVDDGGGEISHNLIHNIAQSGIYTRHWATKTQERERRYQEQGLICEYNEIYNVMEKINDGGGFFVRDSNIIIRNNLIHDVYSYETGSPGWGIYLGCETRDTLVERNVIYRTRESVHVWYSNRNNIIRNNIFSDCQLSHIWYQNPRDRNHDNIICERNIFFTFQSDADVFRVDEKRSAPVLSDYNVFWNQTACVWDNPVISGMPGMVMFRQWQLGGYDQHSLVHDPLFVDYLNDDYTLKPGSPAFKLGFEPIDLSTVGLRGRTR